MSSIVRSVMSWLHCSSAWRVKFRFVVPAYRDPLCNELIEWKIISPAIDMIELM